MFRLENSTHSMLVPIGTERGGVNKHFTGFTQLKILTQVFTNLTFININNHYSRIRKHENIHNETKIHLMETQMEENHGVSRNSQNLYFFGVCPVRSHPC